MIRATIDVNVLLSAVFGPHGPSRQIILAFMAGILVPIVSDSMVLDLERKLQDPRIVRRFSVTSRDRAWILGIVSAYATVVQPGDADVRVVTGDPEDDCVLATAVMGQSDYLVTGDKGLLGLGTYVGVPIISPRDFTTVLRDAEAG